MKQKIDNGVKGSPGRFPRPRVCQFEECGKPTTGYKYCAEHAKEAKKQNHRESERKRHQKERAAKKAAAEQRQNDDRLEAMKKFPPMYTPSDLLHMPPEKSARAFDAILRGDAGMVG